MSSKSQNKTSLQNRPSQIIHQTVAYQGLLPHPDILERFKMLDPNLPEIIIKMAERSFDRADRELDIIAETQRSDLNVKMHEAETKRTVVEKGAKYDFRAQMIILVMIVVLLAFITFLALNEQPMVACVVAAGGFGAIITAAIKGVSSKTK
ncbi:MAG: hypothetical protein FWH22_11265 [Fibromonadales bacterium]|nr:hypothetical protein [Fibromonadales bacterium]